MKTIGVLAMFIMTYAYAWAASDSITSCVKEAQLGPGCTGTSVPETNPVRQCFMDLTSTTLDGLDLCSAKPTELVTAMMSAFTSSSGVGGISLPGVPKK